MDLFCQTVQLSDIPWQRLTTPFGRATEFPQWLTTLTNTLNNTLVQPQSNAANANYQALFKRIKSHVEHQGTLWQVTPWAVIFLGRILQSAEAGHVISLAPIAQSAHATQATASAQVSKDSLCAQASYFPPLQSQGSQSHHQIQPKTQANSANAKDKAQILATPNISLSSSNVLSPSSPVSAALTPTLSRAQPAAAQIAKDIRKLFELLLQCCEDEWQFGSEHPQPLTSFEDMLKPEYLWPISEEYDEERWEEEPFSPELWTSFYYFTQKLVQEYL